MSRPLSVENPEAYVFVTIRTIASRLWFINNDKLTEKIVAFLAKYQQWYGVELYAFVLMGNHYHLIARFPNGNRADFLRSFDAIIARLTAWYTPSYLGGGLWATPADPHFLATEEDVLDKFLYCALNPVTSGVVARISDYPNYNSFSDAIAGRTTVHRLVNWREYKNRVRSNPSLRPEEFIEEYPLTYSKLPGLENLSGGGYRTELLGLLERRRQEEIRKRLEACHGFGTPELLRATEIGAIPRFTKTRTRNSYRPIVISKFPEARRRMLDWYWAVVRAFREASRRYRAGDLTVAFPPGTYRPVLRTAPP